MKKIEIPGKGKNITRRDFLNRAAAGTAVIAIAPITGLVSEKGLAKDSWPSDASKYRFHMIGHAHIDPVWLWPWSEGLAVVHSTFRSALDRMNENQEFKFTASSAQFYQWVSENDPAMLKEIRQRVDEGRWNIVGGWWIEPDVNIPSGEALVRQGLYGQLTLQHLLGHKAKVAFNPDSFGHTGTLPQILKLQGMENYVFMRPGIKEKSLPEDIFWWEGADGSRVLTYRIPISYNENGSLRNRVEQVMTQFREQPVKNVMTYYGAGDHGGGATRENIASIEELKKDREGPAVFFSTPENYFRELRKENISDLPVVNDDLQHHSVGCYTAEAEIKKANRASESAMVTAEKISAVGMMAWGAKYPKQEFTEAWKRILFLQFHDSLAGTSLPSHYQSAREASGYALDIAHQAVYKAVQKLEWQVPAKDPSSQYLLVFNPNAWESEQVAEYDLNWNLTNPSRVEDENGNALAHQWSGGTTETGSRRTLVFKTLIPAFGYRQIRLLKGDPYLFKDLVSATGSILENEFLRINIFPDGTLGMYDKKNLTEVFKGGSGGCRALIINDPSDTWSHDIKSFSEEAGSFGKGSVKVIENGPLRATIRSTTTYGASILSVDWTLCGGSKQLEALVSFDWHEHQKMVKFSFPVDIETAEATYEIPYGHKVRETNGNEEPGQRWLDLTGNSKSGKYGLTVINDAKYGYSVSGSDMRISVLRSAVYAHHNPRVLDMNTEHIWMDQGIHSFRMVLVPHKDSWKENNITRKAEELSSSPVIIYQGIHNGKLARSGSLLSCATPEIIITAIKMSESGNDLIIRCVESSGKPISGTIDLTFAGIKWSGNFRPFEIKTLRFSNENRRIKEVNLLEE